MIGVLLDIAGCILMLTYSVLSAALSQPEDADDGSTFDW